MSKVLTSKILLRNDTTANWTTNQSVVLSKGEVGVEWVPTINEITDPDEVTYVVKIKIGDGLRTWQNLPYYGSNTIITGTGNTITNATFINGTLTLTKGDRVESIAAQSGTPLDIGGTATAPTIEHKTSGATAGTYGSTTAQTPAFGDTFTVPYYIADTYGHITQAGAATTKIPSLPTGMITASSSMTAGQIVLSDGADSIETTGYIISNSFSATPSQTSIPTEYAVSEKVKTMIGNMDALVLVGSINGTGIIQSHNADVVKQAVIDGTTNISGLTAYSAGWVWKVTTAGTITGIGKVEPGDQVITSNDFNTAYWASDWFVIQGNVDVFVGATTSAAGTVGLVPAPAMMANANDLKMLLNTGVWQSLPTYYTFTLQTSTSAAISNTVSATYNPVSGATTYTIYKMKGADGTNAGYQGLVPAPAATDNNSVLFGDGTWEDVLILNGGNASTTYN